MRILVFLFIFSFSTIVWSQEENISQEIPPQNPSIDRIVLTNGGIIEGKIVHETPEMVKIEWEGSVVGFQRSEIESIQSKTQKEITDSIVVPEFLTEEQKKEIWPEGIDHRLLLKNREWVNGQIVGKENNAFVVRQKLEEGGSIEIEINQDQVEKIYLWKPEELDHQVRLSEFLIQYPNMRLLEKDNYIIMSSVMDPMDLKYYLKTLNHFYHDFLIHFFGVFELTEKIEPLDVLIFGTREEFATILTQVGYNAKSNAVGFYHFDAKKLVFYNIHTDKDFQANIEKLREYQAHLEQLKAQYGSGSGSVQTQISQASDSLSREEIKIFGEATAQNVKIIRHEGGHQLFHLTGMTPLEVYAGGWLIEGLAVYCETDPIGDPHEERLMQLRFELERKELMPLEYLLNFKRGTELHQLDPLYANLAYAQSWAFVYFLMHNYKMAFFNFLKDMRIQDSTYDGKGEILLLEKHLGKDLKSIEPEFFAMVKDLVAQNVSDEIYDEYRLRLVNAS